MTSTTIFLNIIGVKKLIDFIKIQRVQLILFLLFCAIPVLLYFAITHGYRAPKFILQDANAEYKYSATNNIFTSQLYKNGDKHPSIKFQNNKYSDSYIELKIEDLKEYNDTLGAKKRSIDFNDNKEIANVRYKTVYNGIKEEIILDRIPHELVIRYRLTAHNVNLLPLDENLFRPIFYTKNDEYLFDFEDPFAIDSKGNRNDNFGYVIKKVKDNEYTVDLSIPQDWFKDKNTVYPVTIDPTITIDESSEFASGTFIRSKDVGSGTSPKVETYYQELASDEFTTGLWHMNETSGTTVTNSSTHTYNGTTVGTTIVDGVFGKARSFNGTSDYIYVTENDIYDSKELSIEAWIYPTILQTGNFVAKEGNEGYRIRFNSTGTITFFDRGATNLITSSNVVKLNTWNHVAATADKSGLRVYINGKLSGSNSNPFGGANTTTGVTFGRISTTGAAEYFAGRLDEVRLSNKARSPYEIYQSATKSKYSKYISEIFNFGFDSTVWNNFQWSENGVLTGSGETPFSSTNLISQWNFNNTSGTTSTNNAGSCGASCNGTLLNFANTTGTDVANLSGWSIVNSKVGGGAIMFDGVDDNVSLGLNTIGPRINGASSITISSWVKPLKYPAAAARSRVLSSIIDTVNTGIQLGFYDGSKLEVGGRSVSADGFQTATYNIPIEESTNWMYVVGQIDYVAKKIRIYINGTLREEKTVTFANNAYTQGTPTTAYDSIGAYKSISTTQSDIYTGIVDATHLYTRTLTDAEILSNYNKANINFRTRIGDSTDPNDGSWEEWKPTTGEAVVETFESNKSNSWKYQRFIPINHTGVTVNEYQMLIDNFNTSGLIDAGRMKQNCEDIRFTNATGTLLNYYIVGNTCNTATTQIWVQVDTITSSGQSIYMYYGNPQAQSYSDPIKTFSYSTEKPVAYVLHDAVDQLEVISMASGNSITHNGVTRNLEKYQTSNFTSVSRFAPITATKPFNADDSSDDTDGLVPISWAGTEFLFNARSTATYSFHTIAPWGNGTMTIAHGGTNCTGLTVNSTGNTNTCAVTAGRVRVTSTVPILMFINTTTTDPMPVKPASLGKWIGTNTGTYVTSGASSADYRYFSSANASETNPADLAANSIIALGGGSLGASPAFLIRSINNVIGVNQYGDGDGSDGTMYMNILDMSNIYASNASSTDYISIASDSPATCSVYNATTGAKVTTGTATSSNTSVYYLGFGTGASTPYIAAPWYLECDKPVAVTYQKGADTESNLFNPTLMRQYTYPTPTFLAMGTETTDYTYPTINYEGDSKSSVYTRQETLNSVGTYSQKYQSGLLQADSHTVGLWRFEETSGTGAYIKDSSGLGNHGTPSGGNPAKGINGNGRYGGNIVVPHHQSLIPKQITIETWVKPTGINSLIIYKYNASSPWPGYALGFSASTTIPQCWVGGTSWTVGPEALTPNEWYHMACTYDGSQVMLYVNGSPVAKSTQTANLSDTTNLNFGWASNSTLDEIRISNIARSQNEISQSYRLGRDYILNKSITGVNISNINNLPYYIAGDKPGKYLDLILGESKFGNYIPDENTVGFWEMEDSEVFDGQRPYNNEGLVGHWRYNDPAGTVIKDGSPYLNHGTATGTTVTTGMFSSARAFNGTSDIITVGLTGRPTNTFTVETWFTTNVTHEIDAESTTSTSGTSGQRYIFGAQPVGDPASGMGVSVGTNGISVYEHSGGYMPPLAVYSGTISAGWHHMAIVYNNKQPSIYLDGTLVRTGLTSPKTTVWAPYQIGGGSYGYHSGNIEETRIYNRALSVGEIKAIVSAMGTTFGVTDSSSKNNTGASRGTLASDGAIGKGKYFNGGDEFVYIPNTSNLQVTGDQTIDMWLYPTDLTLRRNPIYKTFGGEGTITQETTGLMSYYYGTSGSDAAPYQALSSQVPVIPNQWNHIAIVRDLTNMTLTWYINGVKTNTATASYATATASSAPWYIGNGYTNNYAGRIDQVRISNIARSAAEIRQAYEYNSRKNTINIEFAAKLDSTNLIANSGDTSFTIDGTYYGLTTKGDKINPSETIIVKENVNGTEYIAQGVVNSITASTGAITVSSWKAGSTFPASGYTQYANVFKWQREYWPVENTSFASDIDNVTELGIKFIDGNMGRSIWLDDLRTSTGYMTTPTGSTISSSLGSPYFQFEAILTSSDNDVSANINSVILDYIANTKPDTPYLDLPVNGATPQPLRPVLKTTTTDINGDNVRYKIELCLNSEMTLTCQIFDQTSSQTGWSGQNADTATSYTSGTQATYTLQSDLVDGTTYYWRSYAIDPIGTNTWSDTQAQPYHFTTNSRARSPEASNIENYSAKREGEYNTGTTGWTNIPGTVNTGTTASANSWIAGSNFEVGAKYLIMVWGTHQSDNTNDQSGIRVLRGGTPFTESQTIEKTARAASSYKTPYFWFTVWTATNSDIDVQMYYNQVSGTQARVEDITLLAIKADDLIATGDLEYNISNIGGTLTDTFANKLTLNWTPDNNNDIWWVNGYNQAKMTSGSNPVWYDSNYMYRQGYNITNSGGTLTNYELRLVINTAALITAGKMQSDCDDIRFSLSNHTTAIPYTVTGCNTTTTNIYVTIPSLPNGTTTIFMYYGYGSATNGETTNWLGTGADGNITVAANTNINTQTIATGRTCADGINYNVTALTSNTATVTPAITSICLAAGDEILLINLQGAGTFGDNGGSGGYWQQTIISSYYTNTGNYEFLRVQSINTSTNVITFTTNKTKYYGNGASDDTNIGTAGTNQRVMVQRIPQYNNVTINSGITLTASNWGGTRGGVVTFRAKGTVSNSGTISTLGLGYRGGYDSSAVSTGNPPLNGESYFGRVGHGGNNYAWRGVMGGGMGGRDAPTAPNNGATTGAGGAGGHGSQKASGGAGGGHGSGGAGGGAYGSVGGIGSASSVNGGGGGGGAGTWGGNTPIGGVGGSTGSAGGNGSGDTWGYGGQVGINTKSASGGGGSNIGGDYYGGAGGGGGGSYGINTLAKIYFGSGGGQAGALSGSTGGPGANGGGITIIFANVVSSSGTITSRGSNPPNYGGTYYGTGGAGAGGSIYLKSGSNTGLANVIATGGDRAQHNTLWGGGGGGGGVGRIANYYYTSTSGTSSPAAYSSQISSAGVGYTGTSEEIYSVINWYESRLKINGDVYSQTKIYPEASTDTPIYGYGYVDQFTNSAQSAQFEILGDRQEWGSVGLFALRLNAFNDFFANNKRNDGDTISIINEWYEQLDGNPMLGVSHNYLTTGGALVNDTANRVLTRLQSNNANTTDDVGGWSTRLDDKRTTQIADMQVTLSAGVKDLDFDAMMTLAGTSTLKDSWLVGISMENTEYGPRLDLPTNGATNQNLRPVLKLTGVDPDNDTLQYRIEICKNLAMTTSCTTYNQNSSQTGWTGQNANSFTRYTSGTQATHTPITELDVSTTYYWRADAIDLSGTNTWSEKSKIFSFTTTDAPTQPTELQTNGVANPTEVTTLSPVFSAIHNDPNSDNANFYEIEINTLENFTGTVMWDSNKLPITSFASGTRSPNITYSGTTLTYNGQTYYWRIRFWDINRAVSPWSETAAFTLTNIYAPKGCYLEDRTATDSSIVLKWQDTNIIEQGYKIDRQVNVGAFTLLTTQPVNTITYTDNTVSANNTYTYRIYAYNAAQNSIYCVLSTANLGQGNFQFEGVGIGGIKLD